MLVQLAGFGPISDGIPQPIGDGGDSEDVMPRPPRTSVQVDVDQTKRMRKARR